MIKLTSTDKEAAYEIPAQYPRVIQDMRMRLHYLGQTYLNPRFQPGKQTEADEKPLIFAVQALVNAETALQQFADALKALDYRFDEGDPVVEPSNPVYPSADQPMPPDNTDNPWTGEFYN